jgi:hypothetical protein
MIALALSGNPYASQSSASSTETVALIQAPVISEIMRLATEFAFLSLALSSATITHADTFGSGDDTFEIEFVAIGNPGNAADTTGSPNLAGAVAYPFHMGKFEISEDMIDKANSLGGLGITHDQRGTNLPATSISWFEAAKFVNWLNTSTGHAPAYKFDGDGNFQLWLPKDAGHDPSNLFRNKLAHYFLPSVDEWYKAAYYDPNVGVYYDFPTRSNSIPDGIDFPGDPTYDAVFEEGLRETILQPNNIFDLGVLSPHGTAGQGGNVTEWEETEFDLVNDSTSFVAAIRGGGLGSHGVSSSFLHALERRNADPTLESTFLGFRVASIPIPEPTTLLLGAPALVEVLLRRRNRADTLRHLHRHI